LYSYFGIKYINKYAISYIVKKHAPPSIYLNLEFRNTMFSQISAISFVVKAVMMGRYSWSCIHKTSTVAYI